MASIIAIEAKEVATTFSLFSNRRSVPTEEVVIEKYSIKEHGEHIFNGRGVLYPGILSTEEVPQLAT